MLKSVFYHMKGQLGFENLHHKLFPRNQTFFYELELKLKREIKYEYEHYNVIN
jgi:hypothetical protein